MRKIIFRLCLVLGMGLPSLHVMAEDFSGRGVYPFPSSSGCPIVDEVKCDRVALDDGDTKVTLDTVGHQILFENDRDYDKKTIVGDVVIHGRGIAKNGEIIPLSLHAFIYKDRQRWTINAHAHSPVRGKFEQLQLDQYELTVVGSAGRQTLLKPEDAAHIIADPSWAARLAREFVELHDNRSQSEQAPDITVALGLGKLAASVVRVQFNVDGASAKRMEEILTQGSWSIAIQPLSTHVPVSIVRRDLLLFGLDQLPLLKGVMDHGFTANEPLVIGAEDGKGYVRLGTSSVTYPDATKTALAFLQNSFIGEILAWQQQKRLHDSG